METKRLTLFAGHYGSGKTNIAVNYALYLREQNLPVTVADLDIVNPYFRTLDSKAVFNEHEVKLICSQFANSNVDAPAMPKEVYELIDSRNEYGVLDIGGDDRGALALGRYVPDIIKENNYEMLLVINKARPLTRTVNDTVDVAYEVASACSLPFTGIVNNTNLGLETKAEDILSSVTYAEDVSKALNIPIKMTCCDEKLFRQLEDKIDNLFPIALQKLYYHLNTEVS